MFEEVAVILAKPAFKRAEAQYKDLNASIATRAQSEIQLIMDELTTGTRKPNKRDEIERIRNVATSGSIKKCKLPRVDVFLVANDGVEYYIDLKTAKPNMEEFKGFKRKLLEWTANRLLENQRADVHTLIAIPYNPYEPAPYERWTLAGLFDLPEEVRVAAEFWDWIVGKNAYVELLAVFEQVGIEMRKEIDARFARFK